MRQRSLNDQGSVLIATVTPGGKVEMRQSKHEIPTGDHAIVIRPNRSQTRGAERIS
jgi:hypothetical protein